MFGNCPLFGLNSINTYNHIALPVQIQTGSLQMDNTGSQDMIRFKNFFSSIPWQKLVPDFAHTVVMAGYSSGTTTVTTGRASDGSFVVSYMPSSSSSITVDMTKLAGPNVNGPLVRSY